MTNMYKEAFSSASYLCNHMQFVRILNSEGCPSSFLTTPNYSTELLDAVFSEERQIVNAELHVCTELLQPLHINAAVILDYSQTVDITCNVISVDDDDFHSVNIANIDALQVKIGPGTFNEHNYTGVISDKVISVHMVCGDREKPIDMAHLHQLFPSAIHFHIEGYPEVTANIFDYVGCQPDIAISTGKLLVAGATSIIDFECVHNGQGLKLKLANNNVPINTSVCKYLLAKKNDLVLFKNARA